MTDRMALEQIDLAQHRLAEVGERLMFRTPGQGKSDPALRAWCAAELRRTIEIIGACIIELHKP